MSFPWHKAQAILTNKQIESIILTTGRCRNWPQEEIDRVMSDSKRFVIEALAEHLDKAEKEWKNRLHSAGIPHE